VKLKSNEYFTLNDVKPIPYFLIGGRGTGKSYSVKKHIKDTVIQSNFETKYLYVRIAKNEIHTHDSWLLESGITEQLPFDCEDAVIKRGRPYAGAVSLQYLQDDEEKETHIGYVASLETSALQKSGFYSDVGVIVFEEFIRRGMTQKQIENYCFTFMELVETVMRDREIPIFFIANTLNAYNPLIHAFKEYEVIKIFSENRRKNIADGKFSEYLRGELYTTDDYNIDDFNYLTTIKVKDKFLSLYADKFYNRDILMTNAKSTQKERTDLLFLLKRDFVYNFSTMKFLFDNEKTEVFFYTNTDNVKLKLRNKLQTFL